MNNNNNNDKYRIVTTLTKDEKAALKILAVEDGRSMSGYLRSLLVREIADCLETQ